MKLRERIAQILALRKSTAWVTFWCFAWGTIVLAVRFAGVTSTQIALQAGLVGCLSAIVAAAVYSRREIPTTRAVRALMDRDSGAGGLLMATAETDTSHWAASVPDKDIHRISWRAGRPLTLLCIAAIFVWAAFLIPARFVRPTPRLDLGPETARLEEQLEVLKDEEIIDLEKAELLEKEIEELEKNAEGDDPSKAWESLDNLSETMQKAADEAAEEAIQETEDLSDLETATEALGDAAAAMDAESLTAAMKDLDKMAAGAAAKNAQFAAALTPELAAALASGTATKEQLEQLARAAGMSKQQLQQTLQKMQQAGLTNQKTMKQAEAAGQKGNSKALSQYLQQNPGQGLSPSAMASGQGQGQGDGQGDGSGPGGSGGVSRGPGHSALQFSKNTSTDGSDFREIVLPQSEVDPQSVSIPIASSPGLPDQPGTDTAVGGGGATTGALATAAAGGGSAAKQQVRPRHRDTVGRYFERKKP